MSLARNSGLRGIIPASHVLAGAGAAAGEQAGLVQESAAMLREWGRMLRDIYVRSAVSYPVMWGSMREK